MITCNADATDFTNDSNTNDRAAIDCADTNDINHFTQYEIIA